MVDVPFLINGLVEAVCVQPMNAVLLTVAVAYFVMVAPVIISVTTDIFRYVVTLIAFMRGTPFDQAPYFNSGSLLDRQARVHVYSFALIFFLWKRPHYRHSSFQVDLINNLRDVAVPGTGISLKWFCYFKWTAQFYLVVLYPGVCFVGALNEWFKRLHSPTEEAPYQPLSEAFREMLVAPQHWFGFWRLNCRLASFHALYLPADKAPIEADECVDMGGFEVENKWTFLLRCKRQDVATTPWLETPAVVCKHRNEEGGLGINFFRNACAGGDWIIQPTLSNSPALAPLLPSDAPLSTFRVITGSWGGLAPVGGREVPPSEQVFVFSTVFRAGMKGAATDHKSILFNVDRFTGVIKRGTTNAHWYQLGLNKIRSCAWTSEHNYSCHPDKDPTEAPVEGQQIENIRDVWQICVDAHQKLCPKVPLCGWDVALTREHGMLLLEVNLSCNFFRGDFDIDLYTKFVEEYFSALDQHKRATV